ncbi:HATC-domain-containing protein [Mycena venus]|uniref:HATC-domain-containing protein n=1 Tax=Mycena venus TaxID=2733690 RepID=A0A8H7CYC8_9AGAR|nr:HATC-domain-containing protein [Mycena venus]
MSRSGTPTLPWVLPMYEGMLKHLRSAQDNAKFSCLRTAAAAGLTKLENYYSKACDYQLDIIATLLHPSLGITWFRKIDLERDSELLSVTRAEVLFEHVYESYQQIHAGEESRQPKATAQLSRDGTFGSFLDDISMANVEDASMPEIVPESELKRFWSAFKNYNGDRNAPLTWWKEHEHEFPIISRMARDFLAIPGTSVSVERLFSSARHLCHESRSSLKPSTISEAMLTKMWIKDGLLKRASLDCGRG